MTKKSTTFKGQAKPFGKSGHFNEPRRHALQAKGIKTGRKTSAPMPVPVKPVLGILEKEAIHKELEEYQGWANRETWAVKLWWGNNEGDQKYFSEQADEFRKAGKPVYEFADFLKEQAEEIEENVYDGEANEVAKSMMKDVGSLWRVDWNEIAQSYYDDSIENERDEQEKANPTIKTTRGSPEYHEFIEKYR